MSRKAVLFCCVVLIVLVGAAAIAPWIWGWPARSARSNHSPAAGAADPSGGQLQLVGTIMGTAWTVRLRKPLDPPAAAKLQAEVQATLDRLDGQMSTWKATSELSRFNAYRGADWFAVPADLAAVVAESRAVSEASGGAFDVTVAPLVTLWGFGPGGEEHGVDPGPGVRDEPATRQAVGRAATSDATTPNEASRYATPIATIVEPVDASATRPVRRVPPDEAIARAKARVDYHKLEVRLTPPALRKLAPDLAVDLSAVAPGYASDRVADLLNAAGIADYFVNLSSEIRARGQSPRGGPWRVAIQQPIPDTVRVLRIVALPNLALSPSGDYQNFFDEGGKRYCHEIDPRTGRPIDHALASVAVVHPSAARADAMATALMVLGPDAGYDLAVRMKLAAFFVARKDGRFETRATPAFEPLLLPERRPEHP